MHNRRWSLELRLALLNVNEMIVVWIAGHKCSAQKSQILDWKCLTISSTTYLGLSLLLRFSRVLAPRDEYIVN